MTTKTLLFISVAFNLYLIYFIAKRYYYNKIPPVLWRYDVAMLGDSHIARGNWNNILGLKVANFGKPSDRVSGMLERLPGVINCKPKVCFIHGGINDIINEVPLGETLQHYKEIVERLKAAGIKPVIIPVMNINHPGYKNKIAELNKKISALADTMEIEILPDDINADGIHMTGAGYEKWKSAILGYWKALTLPLTIKDE